MNYDPSLTVTQENRQAVVAELISAGHLAPSLAIMSNVGLANLYHAQRPDTAPTELQLMAAEIIRQVMPHSGPGKLDEDLVRYLARQEAQAILDALPPRQIEVVSPRGTITLDGPMHYCTPLVVRIVGMGHAVMMVGPAGCGKTTIAEHTAAALQLPFYITSTINDTHELMGFVDGHGRYHDTPFRNAFEHGGVWVADEIDAWDASALLAANSALANGYANFPDSPTRVMRHTDFRMVATANTFGTGADRVYVGRNELDAASLDRFAVVEVGYDLDLERMFAGDQHAWLDYVWNVRRQVQDKKIRHVVSSRAINMGATALRNGLTRPQCEDIYLYKGMSAKDRDKIQ